MNHEHKDKQSIAKGDPDVQQDLLYALAQSDELGVKACLARGADVHRRSDAFGETPLHVAAGGFSDACAKLLIEAGAEINARDDDDWTPLTRACSTGMYGTVNLLLEAGAELRDRDIDAALEANYPDAAVAIMRHQGLTILDPIRGKTLDEHFAHDQDSLAEILGAQRSLRAAKAAQDLQAAFGEPEVGLPKPVAAPRRGAPSL